MADKRVENILSIRGMSKSFGRNRVLDHISLDVKPGTVMGLMGENGAGKSTMMPTVLEIRDSMMLLQSTWLRQTMQLPIQVC